MPEQDVPLPIQHRVVWVIGGDALTIEPLYRRFGSPVVVVPWHLKDAPAEMISDKLVHSKKHDCLALDTKCTGYHAAVAVAMWFMLHDECLLIATEAHGQTVSRQLSKLSMLGMIEYAKTSYDSKASRS